MDYSGHCDSTIWLFRPLWHNHWIVLLVVTSQLFFCFFFRPLWHHSCMYLLNCDLTINCSDNCDIKFRIEAWAAQKNNFLHWSKSSFLYQLLFYSSKSFWQAFNNFLHWSKKQSSISPPLLFNNIILPSIYVSYILVLSYFHPSNCILGQISFISAKHWWPEIQFLLKGINMHHFLYWLQPNSKRFRRP